MKASLDNVAGVRIPRFEQEIQGRDQRMALTGLGAGGKAVQVIPGARVLDPEPSILSPKPYTTKVTSDQRSALTGLGAGGEAVQAIPVPRALNPKTYSTDDSSHVGRPRACSEPCHMMQASRQLYVQSMKLPVYRVRV